MEKITKSIEVPFFWGFYNSPLDGSESAIENEIDYYRDEEGMDVDWDDFDFNMKDYQHAVCESFIENLKDWYLVNWIENIEYDELWSPNYYNFENDRLYVKATLTDDCKERLEKFFITNREWLTEHIRKDWTSRSGFTSYIANDYEAFYEETMNLEPRYLSIVWQYSLELENQNKDMYMQLAIEAMDKFALNDSEIMYVTLNKKEDKPTNDNGE